MLCQFTVKNYKSIREKMTFDMQASGISEHSERVIKEKDNQMFLPVSAIYGPNGGGKSNVLEAIQTLITIVLRPVQAAGQNVRMNYKLSRVPVKTFLFSPESKIAPTEFCIFRMEPSSLKNWTGSSLIQTGDQHFLKEVLKERN